MANVNKYWNNAISFEQYLKDIENEILSDLNPDFTPYYELNKKRMDRLLKTYQVKEAQIERFEELNYSGKLLIISEGWCGDAAQSLPVIYRFFEKHLEIKIVYRDQNEELMNQFLTNGSRSIPIVLILNEDMKVIGHWGPRPEFGNELFDKFKYEAEIYPKEKFMEDLQRAYHLDKGTQIIEEMINRIAAISIYSPV
ncbi:MAG: thioredoxin family protein [Ginsengibacter sp.]